MLNITVPDTGSWVIPGINLARGTNTIRVTAQSAGKAVSEYSNEFNIAYGPPVITVDATVMNVAHDVAAVTLTGTVTANGGAVITVAVTYADNTSANVTSDVVDGATWSISTPLKAGTNTIVVSIVAQGVSGNSPVTLTITQAAAPPNTTRPTITLLGSATLSIALGAAYTDAGATAIDDTDGNITASITTTITFNNGAVAAVNTNTAGVYTIVYNVSDTAGNPATPVTRTVTVMADTTPTAKATESVTVSEKTIEVGGSSITVESRTIQVEVTTGVGEAPTITGFSAGEVLKEVLETIANKAIATGGIDFTKAPPSIDSTITPTLVVNTAVDITVNEGACPAKGCEVTLSYEASDEQAGKDLYVFHYDGAQWEALPHVRRDTINRKVTALATSFSPFALFNASRADKLAKQLNKDILPNLK